MALRRSPLHVPGLGGADNTSERVRNQLGKATKAVRKDAGVEGASYDTLRHTAASFMVQVGMPLFEVQQILGHSTPAVTQRYARLARTPPRGGRRDRSRARSGWRGIGDTGTPRKRELRKSLFCAA